MYFLFVVPFVAAFGDVGDRVMRTPPLDADNAPVDDDWRRESESKFFTLDVNESRFKRGRGDEATYLLFKPDGMLTTVVAP